MLRGLVEDKVQGQNFVVSRVEGYSKIVKNRGPTLRDTCLVTGLKALLNRCNQDTLKIALLVRMLLDLRCPNLVSNRVDLMK